MVSTTLSRCCLVKPSSVKRDRVGANRQVGDSILPAGVGCRRANFFDERRARHFDEHTGHHCPLGVADGAGDVALLGRGSDRHENQGRSDQEGRSHAA